MYNGIGLVTARGSGTNGYVQRNLSSVRQRPKINYQEEQRRMAQPLTKKPNQEILEHERKREIELQVFQWAEENGLFEGGLDEADIQAQLAAKREELKQGTQLDDDKIRSSNETHKLALAQQKRAEAFGHALGISSDYVEGSAFDRELQEVKRATEREERIKEAVRREKRRIEDEERREEDRRRERRRERERERERRHVDRDRDSDRGRDRHGGRDSDRHDRERGRDRHGERDHEESRAGGGETRSMKRRRRSASRWKTRRRRRRRRRW